MLRSILAVLACAPLINAAPSITKIEPPNWWVRHTLNQVQVLVTGEGLTGAAVSSSDKRIGIEVRRISENGHYLFAYLTIDPAAQPGKYVFDVKTSAGMTTFPLTLEAPLDPAGRFQGFSSEDVIYLIMPDRFANGDPSNDNPPGLGRPVNRASAR